MLHHFEVSRRILLRTNEKRGNNNYRMNGLEKKFVASTKKQSPKLISMESNVGRLLHYNDLENKVLLFMEQ